MSSIAAGHPECCEAGSELLAMGGNAVDASVAATLTAFVSEVGLTGPFGGGFALVAGDSMAPVVLDFFADVPGRDAPTIDPHSIDFKGVDVSFGPTKQTFHIGRGSVAVSSVLHGLLALHQRRGHVSWSNVCRPAVDLAQRGPVLTAETVKTMSILAPIMSATPEAAALFLPRGRLPRPGERLPNPQLADFIENADPGLERLSEAFNAPDGLVSKRDISEYAVIDRPPLRARIAGYELLLNPPPSSGGALVAFGLKLLENAPESTWYDDATAARMVLAAMAVTLVARRSVSLETLTNDDEIERWYPLMETALDHPPPREPTSALGSTTHVSVMDASGLACSITTSNGEGCGVIVPRTGAMGNNFLGEQDLNPNGFHNNPVGRRLTSMMCPVVLLRDGEPVMALGTGGSNRIRTALLQVLTRIIFRGQSLTEAIHAPRFHYENETLYIERRCGARPMPRAEHVALERVNRPTVQFDQMSMFFGGVHAAGSIEAVGDPRRQGTAARV